MTTVPLIPNDRARRIFLQRHALADPPVGPGKGADLCDLITRLGFVQVDSINTVARAHDMILYARRPAYRSKNLFPPLEKHRQLFEHWTHDASVIPVEYFPHWQLRFERDRERLRKQWQSWRREGFAEKLEDVVKHISDGGPVCSAEVGADEERSSGGWWDWHPSKTALEYLWRTGALSVTRREGFRKYYDLTERVIPDVFANTRHDPEATIEWACSAAMDRLGFATSGELAAFWALITPAEAKAWCARALAEGRVVEVDVAAANGTSPRRSFAWPETIDENGPAAPNRIRVLSPFDPALRDRKRAERLFGFHYRIEVFVPEPKRIYGYYVFPLLEGETLIGRIDMKCDREAGVLNVKAFWPEVGVKMGSGRIKRLETELDRVARFAGVGEVIFAKDWLRGRVVG